MEDNIKNKPKPAIWNPDKALEGVFCPTCGCWMDDYYGQPDKCPRCGQALEGWIYGSGMTGKECIKRWIE